jgi:HK97 gp10 family phage protein
MATKVSKIRLEGDKELKAKLEMLKGKARGALMTSAEAGADPIRDEMQRLSPGGAAIFLGNQMLGDGTAEVDIGFDEEQWYLRFFEFGASDHEIKGAPLAFEGESGLVITGSVQHPGMPAQPFMRPAADNKKEQAKDAAGEVFRKEIDKLVESQNG